jgi:L-alanine-DL-glutamate epimerase-like enolase superfamily enzyme
MKITDVTVTVWEWKGIPPTRYTKLYSSSGDRSTQIALIKISTDAGVDGYGFFGSSLSSAKRDAPYIVERLKPILMGQDPLDRGRLWATMARVSPGTRLYIVGSVDVALWDLAGRAAGVPVHQLLGSYRQSVPAYASSYVHETPEEYAEDAISIKEQGFHAYKIHPHGDQDFDIKICEAVRKAVGDDYRIMLDSTWSYDYPAALRVGRAIQDLGFYWYEDPLAHDDLYGYVKLREQLGIPIMATELPINMPTDYAPWIQLKATDYLRGDVALKGGITPCMKTAHTAETFRMNYEVHHGGNSWNNHANLHIIAAIPNCEYFEVLLPADAQKNGLVNDLEIDENGLVHVPNEPGIGVEIDFEMIERNKVAELS